MEEQENDVHPTPASWMMVGIAWVLVGVPLLWGVFMTLKKAAQLFR